MLSVVLLLGVRRLFLVGKELAQVLLHVEPRSDRVQGGVGVHLGGIEVQLLAPDQARLDAHLYDPLEELSEHRKAEAIPDAGEAGVVGQWLVEIVAHVPPHREAVGDDAHQFPLATDALIEHDQLQTEEHFGVDARTARGGVAILHQFPHEGEIELLLKTAVEVVLWNEIFEGDVVGE